MNNKRKVKLYLKGISSICNITGVYRNNIISSFDINKLLNRGSDTENLRSDMSKIGRDFEISIGKFKTEYGAK